MNLQEQGNPNRKILRGPEAALTGKILLAEVMAEVKSYFIKDAGSTIVMVDLTIDRRIKVTFLNNLKPIEIPKDAKEYDIIPVEKKVFVFQHMDLENVKLKQNEWAVCDVELNFTGYGSKVALYQVIKNKKYPILIDHIIDIHGKTHLMNRHGKHYKVSSNDIYIANKKNYPVYGRRLMHPDGSELDRDDYRRLFLPYERTIIPPHFNYRPLVNRIRDNIELFSLGVNRESDSYFPDFIKHNFNIYYKFFNEKLRPIISRFTHSSKGKGAVDVEIDTKLLLVINGVQSVIDKYYRGNILEATITFNNLFDQVFDINDTFSSNVLGYNDLAPGSSFYRARSSKGKVYTKEDLFHVRFNDRHVVSINRYSIPGVPALYMGSDPHTCHVELNEPALEDLVFSRLENEIPLRVIKIQRFESMLSSLYKNSMEDRMNGNPIVILHDALAILGYVAIFPMFFACTVKVGVPNSSFKPEYIIPQLLLQKVRNSHLLDGIEYPSSKIDYYMQGSFPILSNYVFPVKTNKKQGFCDELKKAFNITEPTSLPIEKAKGVEIGEIDGYSFLHIINSLESKPVLPIQ